MTFPSDVGVIDLMMGIPEGHKKDWYGFLRAGLMDEESKEMEFPVEYMFKGVPEDIDEGADPVAVVLGEMDHFGIEKAMLGTSFERGTSLRADPGAPRPVLRLLRGEPEQGHAGRARPREGLRDARHQGRHRVPGRDDAAGADQRQALLPDLRQVHRARHPDLHHHRRARARGCRCSARRPSCSTRCAGSSPS